MHALEIDSRKLGYREYLNIFKFYLQQFPEDKDILSRKFSIIGCGKTIVIVSFNIAVPQKVKCGLYMIKPATQTLFTFRVYLHVRT